MEYTSGVVVETGRLSCIVSVTINGKRRLFSFECPLFYTFGLKCEGLLSNILEDGTEVNLCYETFHPDIISIIAIWCGDRPEFLDDAVPMPLYDQIGRVSYLLDDENFLVQSDVGNYTLMMSIDALYRDGLLLKDLGGTVAVEDEIRFDAIPFDEEHPSGASYKATCAWVGPKSPTVVDRFDLRSPEKSLEDFKDVDAFGVVVTIPNDIVAIVEVDAVKVLLFQSSFRRGGGSIRDLVDVGDRLAMRIAYRCIFSGLRQWYAVDALKLCQEVESVIGNEYRIPVISQSRLKKNETELGYFLPKTQVPIETLNEDEVFWPKNNVDIPADVPSSGIRKVEKGYLLLKPDVPVKTESVVTKDVNECYSVPKTNVPVKPQSVVTKDVNECCSVPKADVPVTPQSVVTKDVNECCFVPKADVPVKPQSVGTKDVNECYFVPTNEVQDPVTEQTGLTKLSNVEPIHVNKVHGLIKHFNHVRNNIPTGRPLLVDKTEREKAANVTEKIVRNYVGLGVKSLSSSDGVKEVIEVANIISTYSAVLKVGCKPCEPSKLKIDTVPQSPVLNAKSSEADAIISNPPCETYVAKELIRKQDIANNNEETVIFTKSKPVSFVKDSVLSGDPPVLYFDPPLTGVISRFSLDCACISFKNFKIFVKPDCFYVDGIPCPVKHFIKFAKPGKSVVSFEAVVKNTNSENSVFTHEATCAWVGKKPSLIVVAKSLPPPKLSLLELQDQDFRGVVSKLYLPQFALVVIDGDPTTVLVHVNSFTSKPQYSSSSGKWISDFVKLNDSLMFKVKDIDSKLLTAWDVRVTCKEASTILL